MKPYSYTMTDDNNAISIDALFRLRMPEEDATADICSGWPAMETLLEIFLPVANSTLPVQDGPGMVNYRL